MEKRERKPFQHQEFPWTPAGYTPHRHVPLQQQQKQVQQQQQQQQQNQQRRQDCARRLEFELTLQAAKDAEIWARVQQEAAARRAGSGSGPPSAGPASKTGQPGD